jgi:hypothetical protein
MARRKITVEEANEFLSRIPEEKLLAGMEALAKSGQIEKALGIKKDKSKTPSPVRNSAPMAAAKKDSSKRASC